MCRGMLANHTMCKARDENIAYIKCPEKRATSGITITFSSRAYLFSKLVGFDVNITENEKLLLYVMSALSVATRTCNILI